MEPYPYSVSSHTGCARAGAPVAAAVLHSSPRDLGAMAQRLGSPHFETLTLTLQGVLGRAGAPVAAAVLHSSPHDLGAMAQRLGSARPLSAAFWCNEAIVGRCATWRRECQSMAVAHLTGA